MLKSGKQPNQNKYRKTHIVKAVTFSKYGSPDVLQVRDVEKPTPQDDEVLVKIHASSVNPVQWYTMTGLHIARLAGSVLRKPKNPTLGSDFAGVVEAVGKDITHIKAGDEVFGGTTRAFAEYACVCNAVTSKPTNLTFEQAATIPSAALTALQGIRDYGKIQWGQKVLITARPESLGDVCNCRRTKKTIAGQGH